MGKAVEHLVAASCVIATRGRRSDLAAISTCCSETLPGNWGIASINEAPSRLRWPAGLRSSIEFAMVRWIQDSVGGQLVGGVASGIGGAAQEVGDQVEFGVGISRENLVHRGVHPRVEAEQLGGAVR
jgi:hypothetical protein